MRSSRPLKETKQEMRLLVAIVLVSSATGTETSLFANERAQVVSCSVRYRRLPATQESTMSPAEGNRKDIFSSAVGMLILHDADTGADCSTVERLRNVHLILRVINTLSQQQYYMLRLRYSE